LDREDLRFRSADADCAGWLYRPEGAGHDGACVVLAHGFGGVKEARLGAYAERFAAAGYVALVFDYRGFGDSAGEPRLLIDIKRQRDDWRAALAHARGLDGVDPRRVAAWGTSFSGGHVVEIAAAGEPIAAGIAQAPFMSGFSTLWSAGPGHNLRLTAAGIRDVFASLRGGGHSIAVVGPPRTTAAMTSPDAEPGYKALFPPGYEWPNSFLPRGVMTLPLQRPYTKAKRVTAPLLVQVMAGDVVTPPEPARKAARSAPRGELVEYPGGHFEVYLGEPFERAVTDQIAFLDRHLAGA
jgi:alpha-beta hydrolase superfamily lysophospholipase